MTARFLRSASLLLAAGAAVVAADLPTGGKVQSGQATLALSGSSLTVSQASSKLVVDWDGFSVGQGNKVQFVQPSSASVVLNRVVGADPSVIRGSIQANGQVFLVNTNGVFFGIIPFLVQRHAFQGVAKCYG